MASKWLTLFIADPDEVKKVVQGERPEIVDQIWANEPAPDDVLRPFVEKVASGNLDYKKEEPHPDGLMLLFAIRYVIASLAEKNHAIDVHEDKRTTPELTRFIHHSGEASWLKLPESPQDFPVLRYRSPETLKDYRTSFAERLQTGDYNHEYIPERSMTTLVTALLEAEEMGYGTFLYLTE